MDVSLLKHSPALIVATHLRNEGIGTNPVDRRAWPVYVGFEPAAPEKVISIFNPSGFPQGRRHDTGETFELPQIQARVRAKMFEEGDQKMRGIFHAFNVVRNAKVTIESTTYNLQSITITIPMAHIGRQPDTGLEIFVLNARLALS